MRLPRADFIGSRNDNRRIRNDRFLTIDYKMYIIDYKMYIEVDYAG